MCFVCPVEIISSIFGGIHYADQGQDLTGKEIEFDIEPTGTPSLLPKEGLGAAEVGAQDPAAWEDKRRMERSVSATATAN